jgi:hypothetical protein
VVGVVEFEAVDLVVEFGVVELAVVVVAVFDRANHELQSIIIGKHLVTYKESFYLFTMAS